MARTHNGRSRTTLRRIMLVGLAFGLLGGLLGGSQAHADDLTPPTWNRDGLDALRAHWGFEDAEHPTSPDAVHNPFQGPVQMGVGGTSAYLPTLTGRTGVWALVDPPSVPGGPGTGTMNVVVPNANRPGRKEVWVQITYLGVLGKPRVDVPGFTKTGESVRNADADGKMPYTEDPNPNQPWKHLLSKWTASTCPAAETVTIRPPAGGVAKIDQLVIDTICR